MPFSAHCDSKFRLHLQESLGQATSVTRDDSSGNTKPLGMFLLSWLLQHTSHIRLYNLNLSCNKTNCRNAQLPPWGNKAAEGRQFSEQCSCACSQWKRAFPLGASYSQILKISCKAHRHFTTVCSICWPAADISSEGSWPLLSPLCGGRRKGVGGKSNSWPIPILPAGFSREKEWWHLCQTPCYPTSYTGSKVIHAQSKVLPTYGCITHSCNCLTQ